MPKTKQDPNITAHTTLNQFLERNNPTRDKNPAAIALERLGGLKGGKARAAKLSKEERSAIARKAATKRWQHMSGKLG